MKKNNFTESDLRYKIEHHLFLIQEKIFKSSLLDYVDFENKILNETDSLLKLKARDLLFELEGLLRLHLKNNQFDKDDIKKAEKCLKFLKYSEDSIGKLDLNSQLEKIEPKNKKLLTNKEKEEIKNDLKEKWKNIEEIKSILLNLKFEFESLSISKLIKNEILRIEKKSKKLKPIIYLKKYNYNNLEAGFHEWRRAIRWISIYLQFYKPLFFLKTNKKTPYSFKQEFKKSVFTQFPKKSLIEVDEKSFYELSAYIYYSGKAKDKLEEDILLKRYSFLNREFIAKETYKRFEKEKVLKNLRKSIKVSI